MPRSSTPSSTAWRESAREAHARSPQGAITPPFCFFVRFLCTYTSTTNAIYVRKTRAHTCSCISFLFKCAHALFVTRLRFEELAAYD